MQRSLQQPDEALATGTFFSGNETLSQPPVTPHPIYAADERPSLRRVPSTGNLTRLWSAPIAHDALDFQSAITTRMQAADSCILLCPYSRSHGEDKPGTWLTVQQREGHPGIDLVAGPPPCRSNNNNRSIRRTRTLESELKAPCFRPLVLRSLPPPACCPPAPSPLPTAYRNTILPRLPHVQLDHEPGPLLRHPLYRRLQL